MFLVDLATVVYGHCFENSLPHIVYVLLVAFDGMSQYSTIWLFSHMHYNKNCIVISYLGTS